LPFLRRTPSYDRARFLARAARASRRGGRRQRRKAIALIREVLAHEPDNQELHRKLAALLAADGQSREAWASYRKALEHLLGRGFADQAVGVCREAVRSLPREASTWRALAALEVERQRPADAICALLEGRSQFRSRSQRAQALELLSEARRIDPSHVEAGIELARLLARSGNRASALSILEELIRAHPGQLRRLCAVQFRIAPGLRSACRWLSARRSRGSIRRVPKHSGRAVRSR
jgi:tetratricopeptide (TPR) repeat protein